MGSLRDFIERIERASYHLSEAMAELNWAGEAANEWYVETEQVYDEMIKRVGENDGLE